MGFSAPLLLDQSVTDICSFLQLIFRWGMERDERQLFSLEPFQGGCKLYFYELLKLNIKKVITIVSICEY